MNLAPMSRLGTSSINKDLVGILLNFCRDWINHSFKFKHLEEKDLSVIYTCSIKILFSLMITVVTKHSTDVSPEVFISTVFSSKRKKIFTIPLEWHERFLNEEYQFLSDNPIHQKTTVYSFQSLLELIFKKENNQHTEIGDFTFLDWIGLYEFLSGYQLVSESGIYSFKKENISKKKDGKFYTPESIVNFIVESTLEPLCKDRTAEEILSLRVLDPAMGCGQFLHSAAMYLRKIVIAKQRDRGISFYKVSPEQVLDLIISNCVYGVDKDPFAVFLTHWLLTKQCNITDQGTGLLAEHLKVGDSLSGSIRIKEEDKAQVSGNLPLFNWQEKFPEIFQENHKPKQSKGFDAVIGNPPWISFGLRGTGKLTKEELEYYRLNFPDSAEYKISSYALFMERAVKLLAPGGYHSFIVPDSFLNGRYFSRIRNFLLEKTNIIKILILDQKIWKGVHAGRYVIYLIRKSKKNNGKKVYCETHKISKESGKILSTTFESVFIRDSNDLKKPLHGFTQNARDFLNKFPFRFRLVFDQSTNFLLHRVERNSIPLGKLLRFYSGLIGRKGKTSIVHSVPHVKENGFAPLIESGKCLDKYQLAYHGYTILKDGNLYKSGYTPEIYENPKVFLNQTGYTLKAYLDSKGYYCLNNLHVGYSISTHYSLAFLTAILNSQVMEKYYHAISMEYKRPLAQIDIDMIETIPIPEVSFRLSMRARLKWITVFPLVKIFHKKEPLKEKEVTKWQRDKDTKFEKMFCRKEPLNEQEVDIRRNSNKSQGYVILESTGNYEMMEQVLKKIKDMSSDYKTVLHDWIHINSCLLMQLFRKKANNYQSCLIECDPPEGINGCFYCEIDNCRGSIIDMVRKSIEEMVKILYGV